MVEIQTTNLKILNSISALALEMFILKEDELGTSFDYLTEFRIKDPIPHLQI